MIAPAVTAFVWWLVKRGPDVDAWSIDHDHEQQTEPPAYLDPAKVSDTSS